MNVRERIHAILHYQPYDSMPVVHFGYWSETLAKWAAEGHITQEESLTWGDGNLVDQIIAKKLGFDFNWFSAFFPNSYLVPCFETKLIEELPDGSRKVLDANGVIILQKDDAGSIPAEIDHLLKTRADWEEHYKHRYNFIPERVTNSFVRVNDQYMRWDQGGMDFLKADKRDYHLGLYCGSLFGNIRNFLGVVGASYLLADDEDLFDEIINVNGEICYQCTKLALESGAKFDFAHFWEDICFKSGPLIKPSVFRAKVGPHYKRITELCNAHGIDIVSVDCDGKIDALLPVWLENGVNTMFPIEVGTWNASIEPWREQYGKDLRGVGGMNKVVFSHDRAAVDVEIERLRKLIDLGGFIPCPDHRIAPDAEWDNVRYYCDRMHQLFS